MGTITARKRSDKTMGYTAQIRIKDKGKVVYTESKTFDRQQAASNWLKKRESELAQPGALEKLRMPDPPLADVIDHYIKDTKRNIGKTKAQVLNAIKASDLGKMQCSKIGSAEIIAFAQGLDVQPQTVGNYLAHLSSIFAVAKPAWGYQLDKTAMDDARTVAWRIGVVSRSNKRDRRPTLDELDKLLNHFGTIRSKRIDSIPMQDIVCFAIFSTRRLEEITRIDIKDLDAKHSEIIVRDMKHPGEKIGNDVKVTLTQEALRLILKQKRTSGPIFPFSADSISTSFTRAVKFLGIEDLHFHDLRHEGISRLFEMGWNIPHTAMVSGHRTWTSLKRYTHIRESGDKYKDWAWLEIFDK